eukprot:CAMPEP_0172369640 /NCGR_PEP_ID=MMETSP1060-20121228/33687_1 /TAXON_ID=37318 /ORGANISM="Pseudo-nitzschia pungens, Strain cf. cingulata" /LENGTH=844 /DNA_ID=CAMNT_0013094633 /DNA_START=11 /DNA_END=2545 /DNA_ORIENTATION=+
MTSSPYTKPWQNLHAPSENPVPRVSDVVFTASGETLANHPGNVMFDKLVKVFEGRYTSNKHAAVKERMAESIVKTILEKGGRFLEYSNSMEIDLRILNSLEAIRRTTERLEGDETTTTFTKNNNLDENRVNNVTNITNIGNMISINGHGGDTKVLTALGDERKRRAIDQLDRGEELLRNELMLRQKHDRIMQAVCASGRTSAVPSNTHSVGRNYFLAMQQASESNLERVTLETKDTEEKKLLIQEQREREREQQGIVSPKQQSSVQQQRRQPMPIAGQKEIGEEGHFEKARPVKLQRITDRDIIVKCTRSVTWANNKGNIEFEKLILDERQLFDTCTGNGGDILKHIAETVVAKTRDRSGRFLEKRPFELEDGSLLKHVWHDVGNVDAIAWTMSIIMDVFRKEQKVGMVMRGLHRDTSYGSPVENTLPIVPELEDILWAKSEKNHPGNVVFREMIVAAMQDPCILQWDEVKMRIASTSIVVATMEDRRGRFLEVVGSNKIHKNKIIWRELSFDEAFEKTLRAIHEARGSLKRHMAKKQQEKINAAEKFALPNATAAAPLIPLETDVLFGVLSSEASKHPGNQAYRSLIKCNMSRYRACDSDEKRRRVCKSVVAAISGQDGRFLKFNRSTSRWEPLSDKMIMRMTSSTIERVGNIQKSIQTTENHGPNSARANSKDKPSTGTKAQPIDIIDDYDDYDEKVILNVEAKIAPACPRTSNSDVEQTQNVNVDRTKNECVALMAQALFELQEIKREVAVTLAEYATIENLAKKKTGLSMHHFVNKGQVEQLACKIRQNEKKNTAEIQIIAPLRESRVPQSVPPLPQIKQQPDPEERDNFEYESDGSLVF